MLLSLMQCVFPVLSLKVLALLQHGGSADVPRRHSVSDTRSRSYCSHRHRDGFGFCHDPDHGSRQSNNCLPFPSMPPQCGCSGCSGQQAGVNAIALVLLAMVVFALGASSWAHGVRRGTAPTRAVGSALMDSDPMVRPHAPSHHI